MKKIISYILAVVLLCCSTVVFADEIQEVVVDTSVPEFHDLVHDETYTGSKKVEVADLSAIRCVLLKSGQGNVTFAGKTFKGYEKVTEKSIGYPNCINFTEVATVSSAGTYMVYAVDEYGHDIAVRFKVAKNTTPSGGGGGGGGGGSITPPPITPSTPAVSLVKDVLETEAHIVYMTGYPEGTFGPNNNMTRAEVATMFARLMKEKMQEGVSYESSFSDVTSDAWYYNYVGYMAKFGIITGYEDGTFKPQNTITRAEFITMASRFATISKQYTCNFTDVVTSHWAYDYIAFAATNGWVGGYEDNTFRPDNTITRAEVVTIVNNMLVRDADKAYVGKNSAALTVFSDVSREHWAYYDIVEATNVHEYTKSGGNELWK